MPPSPDRPATPRDAARAFAVVFGGSVVLDAAAGVALVHTVRGLTRRRRPRGAAVVALALTAAYVMVARERMLGWGSTAEEREATLPGDDVAPVEPARTRAVTVDAPVDAVWPWLAQIGQDRGGFYSYDALENLAGCRLHSADRIHPEWQHRDIGELVMLHPANGLAVARFDPGSVLALEAWGTFVVRPLPDGRTRLLARGYAPHGASRILDPLLMEIPHFLMERRMLLGIKARAER